MYDIDFLKAGEKRDADAICMRFTRPDTGQLAHVVLDAGWQEDGDHVVKFIRERYGVDFVDLAIVTHPDGDHIGGMGKVLRGLRVGGLLIHRLDQRGGASLDAGGAVAELVQLAAELGVPVAEPFQGMQYLGGALTVLGPSEDYYTELLTAQQDYEGRKGASSLAASLAAQVRSFADRVLEALPVEEVPFGEGPGPGPRNNSSMVTLLHVDNFKALFTGDAGAPAIEAALDFADAVGLDAVAPDLVQIPHHGSRRNATSALLNRVLGPIGGVEVGNAYVSVCGQEDPKHPAGRVVNAYARRGYPWNWTAGNSIRRSSPDAPPRSDYFPLPLMPAMEELPDED
jgi:beta-lactamase superfamily II metal-dependent hydrolase